MCVCVCVCVYIIFHIPHTTHFPRIHTPIPLYITIPHSFLTYKRVYNVCATFYFSPTPDYIYLHIGASHTQPIYSLMQMWVLSQTQSIYHSLHSIITYMHTHTHTNSLYRRIKSLYANTIPQFLTYKSYSSHTQFLICVHINFPKNNFFNALMAFLKKNFQNFKFL